MESNELLVRNSKFWNKYLGKRCFVVGNGPSLNNIDISKLKNEVCIVASGFFNHPLASHIDPEFYAFADPAFFNDVTKVDERRLFFKAVTNSCKTANMFVPLSLSNNLISENILPYDKTYFVPFSGMRPCRDSAPDFTKSVPSVWNVAEMSIMLAMYLGCSPIYLLGIDHDWLSHRGEDRHFYEGRGGLWDVEREPSNLSECSYQQLAETVIKLWKGYEGLLDYANRIGTRILNATHESFLDIFEFQSYDELFQHFNNGSKDDCLVDTHKSVVATIEPKIARGDLIGAYQCVLRAINRSPDSIELLLLQCDLDLTKGNYDNVHQILSELIEKNTGYLSDILIKTVALLKFGSQSTGIELLEALYNKFNQNRDIVDALSDVLIDNKRHCDALNILNGFISDNPNDILMKEKFTRIKALRLHTHVEENCDDPDDVAYERDWNNPELRKLAFLNYKTPNLADNARRFLMSEGFKEAVSIFISLGKPPNKEIKVLDFGCGNGMATYSLCRIGYNVIGLDSSFGKLAGLKAAEKLNGLDGVEFSLLHSTGETLDFPDEHFDIVWIREVLHLVHNINNLMKEMARILKPGGIICCLREQIIWNESQREHYFKTNTFYNVNKNNGCYYLNDYIAAFEYANFFIVKLFSPYDSVINTYPEPYNQGVLFDVDAARNRPVGSDLFSFFARKPNDSSSARFQQTTVSNLSIDGTFEARCPLTGSSNIKHVQSIFTNQVVTAYKKYFGIDVSNYLAKTEEIKIYESIDTGYCFYYPFDIAGDSAFYEELQKIPWYYMDWKWEHQFAASIIPERARVLEVGCAKGDFLERMTRRGMFCVGLELNEKAAAQALAKKLAVIKESVEQHAYAHAGEYDVVCSFQVAEHVPNIGEFLKASVQALRPGGKLIISVPYNNAFLIRCDNEQPLNRPPHHMGLWDINTMSSLAKIFPLQLDGIELEPLQPYHLEHSIQLAKNKLIETMGSQGLEMVQNHEQAVSAMASLILQQVPGHTLLGHFTKKQGN